MNYRYRSFRRWLRIALVVLKVILVLAKIIVTLKNC